MRSTTPLTDTGTEPVPSAVRQKFSVADCIERITPAAPKPNTTRAQSFPPDEKTLTRYRRRKFLAKTFALPGLQPGSIFEVRFRWKFKEGSHEYFGRNWIVQDELFIREAQLELRTDGDLVRVIPRSMPLNTEMLADGRGVRRATLRDIPAFRDEPFAPEGSLKRRFHVSYPRPFGRLRETPS